MFNFIKTQFLNGKTHHEVKRQDRKNFATHGKCLIFVLYQELFGEKENNLIEKQVNYLDKQLSKEKNKTNIT